MKHPRGLRFKLFCAASTIALGAPIALAQDSADEDSSVLDTVTVVGVRGAQEAAIDIKRYSDEIVDSIVAEDIGKLPDVTISDALQRVTGIQIGRRAGEGSVVSIRGSNNVLATLNGERFVSAESLLDARADFQDVPASLVSGVNVYKSLNASQTDGGTGGIIDLRTIRSLTLDEGLTASGSIQFGDGSIADGIDERYEGLLAYNFGNGVAMSLSASFGDTKSASAYQGTDGDRTDEFSSWICGSDCRDINGDGDTNDTFILPIGWNSFVNSREFERERLGLAYNFEAELGDSFKIVADIMYNEMNEIEHGQELFINGNFTPRSGINDYTAATGQPAILSFFDSSSQIDQPFIATEFLGLRSGLRGGVNSNVRETEALNTNLELQFDNGGPFTGSIRYVHGNADRESGDIRIAQQTDTRCVARSPADVTNGVCTDVNPGSIPANLVYGYGVSMGEDALGFALDDTITSLAADPAAWYLHSNWVEATFTDVSMDVLRADGSYEFADAGWTIDFGVRYSTRDTNEDRADYFSPSGVDGLLNKYAEVGYAINQTSGVAAAFDYDPIPFFQLDGPELSPYLITVTDFGDVPGLNVALPMLDTRAIAGNFEAFRDALYGPGRYISLPDRTYSVDETQTSAYVMGSFDKEFAEMWRLSGNLGLRVVNTELEVTQNIVTDGELRQDILAGTSVSHTAYVDQGDVVTTTDRTKTLPSINLNLDYGEEHRLKFAYQKTMAQQPFQNLGRGEVTFFDGERLLPDGTTEPFQRINSIQRLGNPELEPREQESFSAAWEWYPRDNALISLGVFYNDVPSFTFQRTTQIAAPDSDGVVRDGATLREIAQGEGGSYHGIEAAYQQSFDFLPGLLANTGVTLNYTYSPSQAGIDPETGEDQILADGSDAPLNNTSEHQWNAILFYQDDRFQARIAANYLSEEYAGAYTHWSANQNQGIGVGQFQEPTLYIDAGASYEINDNFQVYLNAQNITEEAPIYYRGFKANRWSWNQWERVVTAGVRARF